MAAMRASPKRPIRVAILTSIRDVGACDLNGCIIETRAEGSLYMEGVVEHMVQQCGTNGALEGLFALAGVITDDTGEDLAQSEYPPTPTQGRQWIHPLDLEDHHGVKITDITTCIPSLFRSLPRDDIKGRYETKMDCEAKVFKFMSDVDADILVLDHYMARVEFLIKEPLGLYGRVVNIHPAVTLKEHPFCFRGCTPTADALAYAVRTGNAMTGATLHIVNEDFDDGPVIHWKAPTMVYPWDKPEELRCRNYRAAKLPVFVEGMKKYWSVFPNF
jgi:folate-dependent phosphoribosylglycinamide formyltransferase PurN